MLKQNIPILKANSSLKEIKGKVLKVNQGSSNLDIQTENGVKITAYIAGKLRKNKIKVLEGDIVTIEIAKSDVLRGRIVKRHKQNY